ncbi:hypothetical protein NKJ26_18320 [Mesorhizobium sp. M0152]|uniref:hypothetical protein n=1 Tax=Mesorhizobium sp. M0152 TaxID=2956898 RepID=UPI003338BB29
MKDALIAFCLTVSPRAPLISGEYAGAIDAIGLKAGADPIERRIDRLRQVQCRVAGQILRRREAVVDLDQRLPPWHGRANALYIGIVFLAGMTEWLRVDH